MKERTGVGRALELKASERKKKKTERNTNEIRRQENKASKDMKSKTRKKIR